MGIADIDIAILAGGMGTRLRDVLPETPKVLAPILGKAFLEHLLDWLIKTTRITTSHPAAASQIGDATRNAACVRWQPCSATSPWTR